MGSIARRRKGSVEIDCRSDVLLIARLADYTKYFDDMALLIVKTLCGCPLHSLVHLESPGQAQEKCHWADSCIELQ